MIGVVVLGAFLWKCRRKYQFPATDMVDMSELMVPYDYNPQPQEPGTIPFRQLQPQFWSPLVLPTPPLRQGGMILSSKAREAARNLTHRRLSDRVTSVPSSDTPLSSQDPPETSSSNALGISTPSVQGLRTEVENLRRAMEDMQAERMEAPLATITYEAEYISASST